MARAKPVLWLDCDGVIVDSQRECLVISYAAWTGEPASRRLERRIPGPFRRFFLRYRGWVQPAREFRALIEAYQRRQPIAGAAIWRRLKRACGASMAAFEQAFFRQRRQFQHRDASGWAALQRTPVSRLSWRRLARGFELRVLTTKDQRSTQLLLRAFGLERLVCQVVGRETIQGDKLAWLGRQRGIGPGVFYLDDNPDYVGRAQKLGLEAFRADWGYFPLGSRARGPALSPRDFDKILLGRLKLAAAPAAHPL